MSAYKNLLKRARKWRLDEAGSIAVETLLMVPLLALIMLSMLVYFDAYRNESISNKAGLAVADMVSRETAIFTPEYLTGMRGLLAFMTLSPDQPDLRITLMEWDADNDEYFVNWSKAAGSHVSLSTSDLAALTDRLPLMSDEKQAFLVETWTDYTPPYNVGLLDFEFNTFIVVSPRFSQAGLCWNPSPTLDPSLNEC